MSLTIHDVFYYMYCASTASSKVLATETVIVGQCSNKSTLYILIINATMSSVYMRNCYVCLRKRSNDSDATTLLKCKSISNIIEAAEIFYFI
jgi:hypothetical protein